ncbi:hypothetical protein GGH94_002361 [Coemansia aciculifera]|uniref:Uncharacterized protein n=1 Tax=Coemansia aciculifera TaxID=417176 RepID=A0A9W8IJX3_9FUNG|nr:hypothetical protein GGH94_002361 [Coemansia aciculifera]
MCPGCNRKTETQAHFFACKESRVLLGPETSEAECEGTTESQAVPANTEAAKINRDPRFNPGFLLEQTYFIKVFMAFCKSRPNEPDNAIVAVVVDDTDDDADDADTARAARKAKIAARDKFYDKLVARHFSAYSQAAQIGRAYYGAMHQSASYAARQAVKDYENNIRNNFGTYLRRAINKVLRIDERVKALKVRMDGRARSDIREACFAQIWAPARAVRAAIAVRPFRYDGLDEHGRRALNELAPILLSYEDHYVFKNSIYYDVQAKPANHFLAFIRLCDFISQYDQAAIDAGFYSMAVNESVAHEEAMARGLTAAVAHDRIEADAEEQRQLEVELHSRSLDSLQAEAMYRAEQAVMDEDTTQAAFVVSVAAALEPLTRNQRKRINRLRRRRAFNARRGHQHPNQDMPQHHQQQQRQRKAYQCCPLRTSFVPGHIHIDNRILHSHFLKGNRNFSLKMPTRDLWGKVVNLQSKPFHDRKGLTFLGAVDTDGISISIILKHPSAAKKKVGNRRRKKYDIVDSDTDYSTPDCPYITSLLPEEPVDIRERLVFNDMGRGDIHYMLGWASTISNPLVFRYTRNQRLDETRMRHYTKLREIMKNEHDEADAIREAELYLSGFTRTTFDPDKFLDYIAARARVWDILRRFYSDTMTTYTGSTHQVHLDLGHIARDYPFHRKLRLNAFINQQQADERLKLNMTLKYGDDLVMVCGNWSAPMAKFHAPIRGRGWRKKFKKFGFRTFLFDKPECNGELETFKRVKNPRPYQRQREPRVVCHGLLQCKICKYEQPSGDSETISKPRVFNRDMAAVLNFRRIIQYYIEHADIPEVFWRPERRRAAAAAAEAAAALANAPIVADAPIVATTTTRARGAARARGAPAVAPIAMDATAESSSSAAAASISVRRSNSTSNSQPPSKRTRNDSA